MILLEQVSKHYGSVKAVEEVSFEVKAGETLVLLGTSGCGKTTTLRMINKLVEPTSGTIVINGQPINNIPPEVLRRGMGYVLQNTGLFPHYTVAENMAVVPKLLKWSPEQIQSRTLELIQKLHLTPEQLPLYPNQLSGGQQQRVGLARALMADPPILLMDEPFGALDPITRAHIRQEFKNLDEFKTKTIVMVTHGIAEAFELADRICLMDKGQIQQIGAPTELLFRPRNGFVQSFLQEQRLSLELKALKVADMDEFSGKAFPAGTSAWEALSFLLEADQTNQSYAPDKGKAQNIPPGEFNHLLLAIHNARKN
jgi:osmoprotectant transport system ATP-binding protein